MDTLLAFDIGGTNSRAALLTVEGNEIDRVVSPTVGKDYVSSLASLAAEAEGLIENTTVIAAGVAVAGCVKNNAIVGSGNLPDWTGRDLAADFERMTGAQAIVVLNDCEAAALGERAVFGHDLVYLIWGTGVGAAVASTVNGRTSVRPTELGHMIIDRNSTARCGCGGYGHLEALIGGDNIPARFKCGILGVTDEQWSEVLADLAIGLRNISCGDLDLPVVLGGGVSSKQLSKVGANRLGELQELVGKMQSATTPPSLHVAQLGEDSGLVGTGVAAKLLAAR